MASGEGRRPSKELLAEAAELERSQLDEQARLRGRKYPMSSSERVMHAQAAALRASDFIKENFASAHVGVHDNQLFVRVTAPTVAAVSRGLKAHVREWEEHQIKRKIPIPANERMIVGVQPLASASGFKEMIFHFFVPDTL